MLILCMLLLLLFKTIKSLLFFSISLNNITKRYLQTPNHLKIQNQPFKYEYYPMQCKIGVNLIKKEKAQVNHIGHVYILKIFFK